MCTVSVSSPDISYYENWLGRNSISRVCFNRNGTLCDSDVDILKNAYLKLQTVVMPDGRLCGKQDIKN